LKCSYCVEEDMEHIKKQDYYVCPKCLGEFWPGKLKKQKEQYADERQYDLNCLAAQATSMNSKPINLGGKPVFKGGSKNGKCRKKKPKKDSFSSSPFQ